MARAIDADELEMFPYSEGAGTEEQISEWIEQTGLSEDDIASRARDLCWKVIDGFINVVKTQPTLTPPNEWISVEDELPDPGKNVLLCFSGHTNSMVVGGRYEVGDGWYSIIDGEYYTDCDTPPTHWMWLPRLPEVDA